MPNSFTAFSLKPGQIYRVKAAFVDYDRKEHPVGETWRFVRHNFVPYDDGLTLYLEPLNETNGHRVIRLRCAPGDQEAIADHFSDFVEVLNPSSAPGD